jgi:hypothetical protein
MSWTFYDAQGREKRASMAVGGRPVEVSSPALAVLTSVTTANNATYVLWPGSAITIPEPGHYLLTTNPIFAAAQSAVLTQGNVAIFKNGAAVTAGMFVDHATFLGGTVHPYEYVDCLAGDVIDLRYSTNNVPVSFGQASPVTKLYAVKQTIGPQGRGGKWWVSGVTYAGVLVNDPANVVAPLVGDVFLYPSSGDTFSYDGQVWVYTGPLPVGGVEGSGFGLPPSSAAVDGQIVHMQDTTMRANGYRWSFAYTSFGDKWEYIGGTPYYLENDAVFTTVAPHTTYQDVGMGFTLPYAGTYLVELSGLISTAAVAGSTGLLSVRFGGTSAQDLWAGYFGTAAALAMSGSVFSRVKLGLAGTQLDPQVQLRANSANAVSVQRKRLACTPIFLNGV